MYRQLNINLDLMQYLVLWQLADLLAIMNREYRDPLILCLIFIKFINF
jgi:hypothetical protein